MVERRTCSFCGKDIEPGTGKMYVRRDGTSFYFCSNRCQKHILKLKHAPARVRWTLHSIRARSEKEAVEARGVGVLKRSTSTSHRKRPRGRRKRSS